MPSFYPDRLGTDIGKDEKKSVWRFLIMQYGIPGVLGVGNGTKRIVHGQTITIDGDAGIVMIHDEDGEFVPDGSGFSDVATNNPHVSGGGNTGNMKAEAEKMASNHH
jgi:hypothetical protein